MTNVINVHDLKINYSKYLEQVISGDEILLGVRGKAVAKIVPLSPAAQKPRTPGALKGKVWASDDFDDPIIALWGTIESKR
jgi:prevent-host-death family protein